MPPRVQLYDRLPYDDGGRLPVSSRGAILETNEPAREDTSPVRLPEIVAKPTPVDAIFATSVLSPNRLLASCYWARSAYTGHPLVLLDFDVGPLAGDSWLLLQQRLQRLAIERRVRSGRPLGIFVESDIIATQINVAGGSATVIPPWLTTPNSWQTICQSAAGLLASGQVAMTELAAVKMKARPFLDAAGVAAGPRGDDPAAPAYLYGVVLALDEAAARDPKPKPPKRTARN